jgi:hypothetical protein
LFRKTNQRAHPHHSRQSGGVLTSRSASLDSRRVELVDTRRGKLTSRAALPLPRRNTRPAYRIGFQVSSAGQSGIALD